MRNILLWLGIMALAAGLSPGVSALDVPLKYEKAPADRSVFFPYGYGYCQPGEKKPAGDWKLPALAAEKPLYGMVKLGDRNHLLVLDMKKAGEKFYSRLYFDSNGNGDLTDDKPIDGTVQGQGSAPSAYFDALFPAVDVTVRIESANIPYRLEPRLYGGLPPSPGGPSVYFSYMVLCAYSGEIVTGGRRYTILLSDTNGNGLFTDRAKVLNEQAPFGPSQLRPQGDTVYLTDGRKLEYGDGLALGDLLLVGATLFDVKIDIVKGKMMLAEIKDGLSQLKLPAKVERLSLSTVDGGHCLMAYKPASDVIMLPAGNYRLLEYHVFRKDEQGDLWRLYAVGTNESPAVAVAPNIGAVLPFGEPYMPVITLPPADMMPSGARGGNTFLSFNVEGRGKEVLSGLTHLEGSGTKIPLSKTKGRENLPKEPAYTIVKADGEIVARGSFEYG